MRFQDEAFDTIISISTLEHVGLDNTILYTNDPAKSEANKHGFVDAIREFKRMLAPGGRCLVTVPYGRYENFDWFQIFDKKMIHILIETFSPSSFDLEFFQYGPAGWRRALELEVTNATAFDPHSGRGRLDDKSRLRARNCVPAVDGMNVDYHIQRLLGRATCRLGPRARLMRTARIRNIRGDIDCIAVGANSIIRGELLTFAHGGKIEIGSWCYVGEGSRIWSASVVEIGRQGFDCAWRQHL